MNNAIQAAIQSKPFLLTSEVNIALNAQKMMTELLVDFKPTPDISAAYAELASSTALTVTELQSIWEQGLQEICTVVAAMNADVANANKSYEQSLVPNAKLRETKVVISAGSDEFPVDAIPAGRYASMVVSHLSMRVQQNSQESGAGYRLQAAIQRQAGFSSVVANYVTVTDTNTNTIHVRPVPSDFTIEDAPRINYSRRQPASLQMVVQNKDFEGDGTSAAGAVSQLTSAGAGEY